MSEIQWSVTSRYATPREFTYYPEKGEVTIVCNDVIYVSYSTDKDPITRSTILVAVDPDGGPYLGKGTRLYPPAPHPALKIVSILEETFDHTNKCLTVNALVEIGEEL